MYDLRLRRGQSCQIICKYIKQIKFNCINIGDKRQTNYTPFGGTAEANDSLELAIRGITYYFNTDATYMFIFRSVKGIDFSTFPKHNRYDIIDVKHRNIYDYAIIGDFRHGIAIAHTTECDFLINSQCEIIFFPRTWYGTQYLSEQQPRFTRNERGFYVETAYIDRSAPGKDTNFQGPYVIGEYSEEQIKEEAQSPIYPYIGKPYEEGRHMFLNGAFYKLHISRQIVALLILQLKAGGAIFMTKSIIKNY